MKAKSRLLLIALAAILATVLTQPTLAYYATIGRATNTGFAADGDRVLEAGNAPIRAEIIEAKLTIRTEREDLQVWAVNAEGNVTGQVPTVWENGELNFTVGKTHPSCYYLICND